DKALSVRSNEKRECKANANRQWRFPTDGASIVSIPRADLRRRNGAEPVYSARKPDSTPGSGYRFRQQQYSSGSPSQLGTSVGTIPGGPLGAAASGRGRCTSGLSDNESSGIRNRFDGVSQSAWAIWIDGCARVHSPGFCEYCELAVLAELPIAA